MNPDYTGWQKAATNVLRRTERCFVYRVSRERKQQTKRHSAERDWERSYHNSIRPLPGIIIISTRMRDDTLYLYRFITELRELLRLRQR